MTDLTKWPRLLVVGEPVTREQANEILIRTDSWRFFLNDQAWETAVCDLGDEYGMPVDSMRRLKPGEYSERWRDIEADKQARRERMGILDLHDLANHRIGSSWIGGPHGWCDWDGKIGCSNYNIGKWPTVEDVTEDWQAIAAAFPYLNLHAQVVTDEGEGEVAATWAVRDGEAALVEPVERIVDAEPDDVEGMVFGLMFNAGRERGVSLERLRAALAQVASQQAGEAS
ncbi:hypothetical protein [Streptomyces sp.]|uniref:hypothetical protein n=1 Tax=Streptomyces sp. TaxID=1931 RepID=UPI002F95F756